VDVRVTVDTSAVGSILRNSASVRSIGTLDPDAANDVAARVSTRVFSGSLPDTHAVERFAPLTRALSAAAALLVLLLASLLVAVRREHGHHRA
jgi:hypothetical protein